MPKKKPKHKETAWTPDRDKWAKLLEKAGDPKMAAPQTPKGGWQLWDWKTLEDVDQRENYQQ